MNSFSLDATKSTLTLQNYDNSTVSNAYSKVKVLLHDVFVLKRGHHAYIFTAWGMRTGYMQEDLQIAIRHPLPHQGLHTRVKVGEKRQMRF